MISIRPCEIKNIGKIFGINNNIADEYSEYSSLMKIIKDEEINLLELVLLDESSYNYYLNIIKSKAQNNNVTEILNVIRDRLKFNLPGNNILRYLLVKMDNIVIKDQLSDVPNSHFHGLHLKNQSIPFDSMPYAMSLYNHNVSWFHLINSIDDDNREYEMLGRYIKDKSEINNVLYTDISEVEKFGNTSELIKKYNTALYSNGIDRIGKNSIRFEHNLLCINSYEKNSIDIITALKEYMLLPQQDILDSLEYNLFDYPVIDLTEDKIEIFSKIFKEDSIAIIQGPAGTGKTKMLEVLATIFKNYKKIHLSNTNTSVENLRRRISKFDDENSYFETTSYYNKFDANLYDILVIDECSTVSNAEMIKILSKQRFKLIVLSGDVYQIESIKYGNWFSLSYNIFKNGFVYELIKPNRTNDDDLLDLWKLVRDNDEQAYNKICNKEYSSLPNDEIFNRVSTDEIILCLNYDGLFGINNINKLLQAKNKNKEYNIGVDSFKIDDPIVFNDCPRFKNLYNNLKGIIKSIEIDDENDKVWFTILVYDLLAEEPYGYEIIDFFDDKTLIKFYVNNFKDTNEDENEYNHIIPFNLAYAISIHKAQGLEYESVKIIITSNIEDRITKNIFYTAITRTKKYLKIFWSSESQVKIFDNMKKRENSRDTSILKQKIGI